MDVKPACVFTVRESLLVFPVATSVVATAARAARTIGGMDSESIVAPLAAALVVGAGIFAASALSEGCRPKSLREWSIAASIAALNSLLLFAAALGIEKF